jgi:hypothetical protein
VRLNPMVARQRFVWPSTNPVPHRPATQDEQNSARCGWVPRRGGLVAAGGMRLWPLGGQTLGFGYLFASDPHIRAGLVSGGHSLNCHLALLK